MSRNAARISVITTTYNRAKDLFKAINSVKAQTFTDWEVVIVDDGSTDDTSKVIAPFLVDRRIRYFRQSNSGVARARNRGAREARGEYLAFLDSDDQWLPEKLERQARLMASKSDGALIYTNVRYVDLAGHVLGELFGTKATPQRGHVSEVLLVNNCVATSSVMLPGQLFKQVGGFDERFNLKIGEDYELWLRVSAICRFDYLIEPLVLYQVHPAQITHKRAAAVTNLLKLYIRILLKPKRYGLNRLKVSRALIKRMAPRTS